MGKHWLTPTIERKPKKMDAHDILGESYLKPQEKARTPYKKYMIPE